MGGPSRGVLFFVMFGCLIGQAQQGSSHFALKDGDCVVFYGDSITEQKLYTSDVEEFVLTRFPRWKVSFVHSGVGGDKVSGGRAGPIDLRLERDLLAYQPTVVTIMLGMNDGYTRPNNPAILATFADGYRHIVEVIQSKAPGVRLLLIKPSPYDDVTRSVSFPGGYNSVLQSFGEFIGDLAHEKRLQTADLNTPVVAALTKAKDLDASLSTTLIPDRVHPGTGVHWVMAEAILKTWDAPAVVTSVTLDATKLQIAVEALNSRITRLRRDKNSLTWTQDDEALPLPLASSAADPFLDLAVRSSDLVDALDREILSVKGLPPAKYRMTIDDRVVGTFASEQLAAGINLALLDTPMREQAFLVAFDTERKNDIAKARFGLVEKEMDGLSQEAADKLSRLELRAVARQRQDAQPVARRYSLSVTP